MDTNAKFNIKQSICSTAISTAEYFGAAIVNNALSSAKENTSDVIQFMGVDLVYNLVDNFTNGKIRLRAFNDYDNNSIMSEVIYVYLLKNLYDMVVDKRSLKNSFISNTISFGGLGLIKKAITYI